MEKNKPITFIHLMNNFSGSPNVLATVAREMHARGIHTTLLSSFNNWGFLSGVPSDKRINIGYTFHKNRLMRALALLKFQVLGALKVVHLQKNEIVYINTILPFLPALAAYMRGIKVVYHIHEAYASMGVFQKICFWVAEKSSSKIICVSGYAKDHLNENAAKKAVVVYNALDTSFTDKIRKKVEQTAKTVLMVSSAREYKGIFEFCKLASALSQYRFVLVCDAGEAEIRSIFPQELRDIPNLVIHPTQIDLHPFYAQSDLILNLSNPKLIVETFGLTILEGMYYALPAIVPPVGGIAELVDEGENGLKIDVNDFEKLKNGVFFILENSENYRRLSESALSKTAKFNREVQLQKIINEIF